jgi:hypothetical protein
MPSPYFNILSRKFHTETEDRISWRHDVVRVAVETEFTLPYSG